MPSTRLQLEGPNLEDLLAQVRRQYGEGARILQAEKVRSGGLGGFFAREHFQIDVEIDGEVTTGPAAGPSATPSAARPAPAVARPGTAKRAYAESSAAEPAEKPSTPAPAAPARSVSSRWTSARSSARSAARSAAKTGSAGTGAVSAPDATPTTVPAPQDAGPVDTLVAGTGAALPAAAGSAGDRSAKPAPAKAPAKVSAKPAAAKPVKAVPAAKPVERPVRSVLDLADSLNEQELGATGPGPNGDRPDVSTETASFAEVLARLQEEADGDTGPGAAAATPPAKRATKQPGKQVARQPGKQVAKRPSKQPAKRAGGTLTGGLPADLLAPGESGFVDGDAYVALLRWLRELPAVPPPAYSPGQVLAVVGEPERALRTAIDLADELGMDQSSVFFASPHSNTMKFPAARRLSKPADLAVRRARWAKRPHGTIVVVDGPLLLRPAGWAKSALSALAPTFTWGAVAATTKVGDVGAWAQRLGHIDALAVDGLEATMDPAAILTGDIPVGMVDGRRSSAQLWAAIITDRLAE
jgi:hypothetical protein